ncbi:YbdK family carboxylate-amine ligase [Conexibacter sp. W3-3-2]|uniref:YbdK family carboxylate-amine ligase n=1 Tax=Conexibacter sp. W3-3-2 TaxID=2675227 RepID=UPI001323CB17|nr:YbdK family carboxylate-amine ligase [Conexibacter sp. W3-3-2]MTD42900.1 YbdK family carboxylate-amine ligase [Conexibacter sp. W3-3-2]
MIDVAAAYEAYATSVDRTVGIEEEFAILDPTSLDLAPRYEELLAACQDDAPLAASVSGELISSEIEIRSGRGEDVHDALARQRDARRRLFALAGRHDALLAAQGTHPWADYREQPNIDTEHYRRVVDGLQYVARRNNTFSLHVHVGVHGADRAIRVCDRLRGVLPTLLAISANSPFLDARDSGLHSARTQAFTKTFPRCGIPDAYGSWQAYADYIDLLVRTSSIVEYTQIWWSVRPHFSFGTVEVRICDAQADAAEADALTELVVACVAQAARDEDEGRPAAGGPDLPARLVEENMWRAIRFGMDGRLLDLDRLVEEPAGAARDRLWEWTAPVRAEIGLTDLKLPARNGAQRQRALLAQGVTMEEAFRASVQETQDTYANTPQEAPSA